MAPFKCNLKQNVSKKMLCMLIWCYHFTYNSFAVSFTTAETGGIVITPLPPSEKKPGVIMKPFFGVEPVLMDDEVSAASILT